VSSLVVWLLSEKGALMSGAEIDFDHQKIIGTYR
jgi:hypothetical protein